MVSALTLSACQPEKQQTITLQGETMGTTYTVKYHSDDQDKLPSPAEKQKRIDDALKEVNRHMTTYQTDSEISQ
ncbi:FAD:protein FMN transferase, partial [Neisseria sp. P0014.S009]